MVRKFVFALVLLAVAVCQLSGQSILLSENFEGMGSGDQVSASGSGWMQVRTSGSPSAWCYMSGVGYGGSQSAMSCGAFGGSSPVALMSPVVALNGTYKLRFKYQNSTSAKLSVYVSTDGGTSYTQNSLVTDLGTQSAWTELEYSLGAYAGNTNVRIVFERSWGSVVDYVYVDDVVIEAGPSCSEPENLSVSGLTSSSALLSWSTAADGDAPGLFQLSVSDGNGNVVVSDNNIPGSQTYYMLSGLAIGSDYSVLLRSDCNASSSGYSDYASYSFRTLCDLQPLPYSEDFDGLSNLPSCYMSRGVSVYSGQNYGSVNGHSLKMVGTADGGAYVIFPQLDADPDDIQFSCRMKAASGVADYQVGLMSDPSDLSSFEPLYLSSVSAAEGWAECYMNTAGTSYSEGPVSVCLYVSDADNTVFVDDVLIKAIPSCIRPAQLHAVRVADDEFTIDWSLSNGVSYNVSVRDVTNGGVVNHTATSHPYTVTGLNGNTDYVVTVQGVCGTEVSDTSAALSVRTLCSPDVSPIFAEGAEGLSVPALPSCWITGYMENPGEVADVPFQSTTEMRHSGSKSLMCYFAPSGTQSYMTTKALELDSADKYELRFWYYRPYGTSYSGEGISVWITPNPTDTVGGTKLQFINRYSQNAPVEDASASGWFRYSYILHDTGKRYIMFVGDSKYGYSSFIDDIELRLAPSCPAATDPVVSNQTVSGATLSWNGGNAQRWILAYDLSLQGEPVMSDSLELTVPSYSFANLDAATKYQLSARIYNICVSGEVAEPKLYNTAFSTLCDAVTDYPFSETFAVDFEPACWTKTKISGSYNWEGCSEWQHAHGDSRSVRCAGAPGSEALFATPQFALNNPTGYKLKFWMFREQSIVTDNNDGVEIYLSQSATSVVNAINLGFIACSYSGYPSESAEGMYSYEYSIPAGYSGNYYVVFARMGGSSIGGYAYIDDVTLSANAGCQGITATVSNVTSSSADLTNAGNEAWEIVYGPAGIDRTQGTLINVPAGQHTYTLTGLDFLTEYDYYVRTSCSTPGLYSDWSAVASFTTTATIDQLPFVCDFEDEDDNAKWIFAEGYYDINNWTIGTDPNAVAEGSHALYIKNGGVYGYGGIYDNLTYAYRAFDFEPAVYKIRFRWKCTGGEDNYDFGRVMLVPASSQIKGGTGGGVYTSVVWPVGMIALDPAGTDCLLLTAGDANGWNTYEGLVDMTSRAGVYNFAAMWKNDYSTAVNYPLAIDDISIRKVTCMEPEAIVSAISDTAATVSVTSASMPGWEFMVSSSSNGNGDVYRSIVPTNSLSLTGLNPNTEYYYTLRAICEPGDTSDWSAEQSFKTYCSAVALPFIDDFEELSSFGCWSTTGYDSPERSFSQYHSGTASMKLFNTNAISPEFNVPSLAPYMVSGWVYATEDSTLISIGVITDPSDASTFESVGTELISRKNQWTEFTAYLSVLNDPDYEDFAAARHVVIAVNAGNEVYFDDISVTQDFACRRPTEVYVYSIMANDVTIGWTENNTNVNQWIVKAEPVYGGNTVSMVATVNPAIITGLDAQTLYDISVASICAPGDTSVASHAGILRTACSTILLPYTEDFESFEVEEIPACWDNSTSTSTPPTMYSASTYFLWGVYSYGGNQMIRMNNYWLQSGLAAIHTPNIALSNGSNFALSFRLSHRANCDSLTLKVSTDGGLTFSTLAKFARSVQSADYNDPGTFTIEQVDLSAFAGETIMLSFEADANYTTGAIFIDDIQVTNEHLCLAPRNMTTSAITSSAVTLSWLPGGTESQWIVRCEAPDGSATYTVSSATNAVVSGLNPATMYSFSVASICSSGDTSLYSLAVTARTACAALTLPYVCGFEQSEGFNTSINYVSNLLEDFCWNTFGTDSYAPYARVMDTRNFVAEGAQALQFVGSRDNDMYLVLPEMNAPTDSLQLSFKYIDEDAYNPGTIEIGYMTNPLDVANWTSLTVLPLSPGFATAEQQFTNAPRYSRIALKINRSSSDYTYSAIDAIRVARIRPCSDIQSLTVTSILEDRATVQIVDTAHTQWQFAFGETGMVDTTQLAIVQNNTLVLGGLNASTDYQLYVRAYCDAAEQSYWSVISFKTSAPAAVLPYICNFADQAENIQWNLLDDGGINHFVIGTDPNALNAGSVAALYVTDGNAYTYNAYSQSSAVAYRRIRSTGGNVYVSFDWKCTGGEGTGNNIYDYGRFYLQHDSSTVTIPAAGKYNYYNFPDDIIPLDGGFPICKSTTEWNHVSTMVTLDSGVYNLIYVWSNDAYSGTANYPLAINNISIFADGDACFPPENLIVDSLSDTHARILWTGSADSYEYELVGTSYAGTTTATSVSLDGLETLTTYSFRVRSICDSDSSAWQYTQFTTTSALAPLPYVCDFENAAENAQWIIISGSQTNRFIVGSAVNNGGDSCLYITNNGLDNNYSNVATTVYATRLFSLGAGEYNYSYDWHGFGELYYDYGRAFLVPVSTALTAGSAIASSAGTPAGCISLDNDSYLGRSSAWQNASGLVEIPASGLYNLVFMWTNDGSSGNPPALAIDNVEFSVLSCFKPQLSISQLTDTAVRVNVTSANDVDTVIYQLSLSGRENAFLTDTIVGSVIILRGLAESTAYNLFVRMHCGCGDDSSWETISFTSSCALFSSYPYTEDFESFDGETLQQNCWLTYKSNILGDVRPGMTNIHGGTHSLEFFNYNSYASDYIVAALPAMADIQSLRLSFWYTHLDNTYGDHLSIGYLSNANDATSFVEIQELPVVSAMTNYSRLMTDVPSNVTRLAFRYRGYANAYVDDINLSQIIIGPVYTDTICYNTPYLNHGFSAQSGTLSEGDNTLSRAALGNAGAPDTLITAHVYMKPQILTILYDTICSGEPYAWIGGTIPSPVTRAYSTTAIAADGCDSIITLYLTVEPSSEERFETICQGDSYLFGDTLLTTPGDYISFFTTARGCTDTVILHLSVVSDSEQLYDIICQGSYYTFGGTLLYDAGIYTDTVTGAHGCPLVRTLHLSVLSSDSNITVTFCHGGQVQVIDTFISTPGYYMLQRVNSLGCDITYHITAIEDSIVTADVYDYVCEGRTYTGNGLISVPVTSDTIIILSTKSSALCDSITNIHLSVVATTYTTDTVSIATGETYEWNDNTYSEAGTYTEVLQSADGCDSIVTLYLIVTADVENVRNVKVDVVPNPVRPGMTAYVYGEFGEVEAVEILNNFGQIIDRFAPSTYPIEVQGLETAGLYYVRVITREGDIYTEKLIVK